MTRSAYVDHNRRLLLYWSAKSACSAIMQWFSIGILGQHRCQTGDRRKWLRDNGYQIGHEEALDQAHAGYRSVAFVRDPFDRIVSAYLDKFVVHRGAPIVEFCHLYPFAKSFYCKVKRVSPSEAEQDYEGLSFVEFLTYVHHRITHANGDCALNEHFNTQRPLLYDSVNFQYDEVHDVRNLDESMKTFNREFGVTFLPGRVNSNSYGSQPGQGFIGETASIDLARKLPEISRSRFANDHTVSLVSEAFSIDYRAFSFEPPQG